VLLCVAAEVEELLRGKYDALLARMEVCCNVLRCVAQLLQCAAVCYRVLQCLTLFMKIDVCNDTSYAPCVLQCVVACCSVLQCVAVCCIVLQNAAECSVTLLTNTGNVCKDTSHAPRRADCLIQTLSLESATKKLRTRSTSHRNITSSVNELSTIIGPVNELQRDPCRVQTLSVESLTGDIQMTS